MWAQLWGSLSSQLDSEDEEDDDAEAPLEPSAGAQHAEADGEGRPAVHFQLAEVLSPTPGGATARPSSPIPEDTPEATPAEEQADLDDMYDFTGFMKRPGDPADELAARSPGGGRGAKVKAKAKANAAIQPLGGQLSPEEQRKLSREQQVAASSAYERVQELEEELGEQRRLADLCAEEREKKLAVAGRARERARTQAHQLEAALSLQKVHAAKLQTQAEQLRGLLVEKEVQLQNAMDEAETAKGQLAQLAPRPWVGQPGPEPYQAREEREPLPMSSAAEEQIQHLAQMAEDLTQGLEHANAAEREAKDKLAHLQACLDVQVQDNKRLRVELETQAEQADALALGKTGDQAATYELAKRLEAREAECRNLRLEVDAWRNGQPISTLPMAPHARLELEERAIRAETELELHLALAAKGKSLRFKTMQV